MVFSKLFLRSSNEHKADIIKLNERIKDLLLDNKGELCTVIETAFVLV